MIWLYLKKLSMKDIKALPAVLSTKTSMRGKGKSSLAQALFKSIKSTHPNFPILLGYRDNIGYPLGLMYEFDEPYFQLFCDLFLDLKKPFSSHASQLSLDKHHVRISINVMLCYFKINVRHIFIGPCKHFLKLCKKLFEIFIFLFT